MFCSERVRARAVSHARMQSNDKAQRQVAYDTVYYASLFHFVIVELFLVAVFGFLGVMDVVVVNSVTMLVIHAAALLISLAMWTIVATCLAKQLRPPSSVDSQMRGAALVSSASVYFLATSITHAVFLAAWIIWVAEYNDLSPLNFTSNVGPFLIKRDLLLAQFLLVFIAFFYFVHDVRYQSLAAGVHTMRSKFAAPLSGASSGTL